jgi:hypothetical protein
MLMVTKPVKTLLRSSYRTQRFIITCSHKPANGRYPEHVESCPDFHTMLLCYLRPLRMPWSTNLSSLEISPTKLYRYLFPSNALHFPPNYAISTLVLFSFSFTGAATLCGSWPPRWLRNSKFFRGGLVNPTPSPQSGGPGTTLHQVPTVRPVWHGRPYQELTLTLI